jgi:hypothetical protein
MLVSHRKKFIFLKTVKTAGTSVESYFEPFCIKEGEWTQEHLRDECISDFGIIGYRGDDRSGKTYFNHISAKDLKSLLPASVWEDYFKFTVVRNPFDKQVSAFYFFAVKSGQQLAVERKDVVIQFRDWLKKTKGIYDGYSYLINGEFVLDDVIHFETLQDDISRIGKMLEIEFDCARLPAFKSEFRPKNSIPLAEYYDIECIDIVRNRFQFELEYFGYEPPILKPGGEFAIINRRDRRPEALVLGNGPSLRGFDFGRLSRFDVFGMNVAYRYWYEVGWFPQYYSCLDLVVGASHCDAIADLIKDSDKLGIRAFLLRQSLIENLGKAGNSPKVFNFDLLRPGFENWIPGPVTTGSHTCAWASILGYKDIYMLGIDCNYVEIVDNAKQLEGSVLEITSDAANPNYFFDSYQKKGDKFNIPNPRKDLHLQSWRNIGEKIDSSSRVLNAGLESQVDQFAFVRFDDVEKGGRVPIFSPLQVIGGTTSPEAIDYVFVPSCGTIKNDPLALSKTTPATPIFTGKATSVKKLRSILAYDADWSFAEVAEQHALFKAYQLLPEVPGVLYFGFPWAAMIDRLNSKESSVDSLKKAINDAKLLLDAQKYVVTVCQHVDMLKYQEIFKDCGITHVFWAHTVKGQDCFPENENIRIFPFPLFPVQTAACGSSNDSARQYLYSFIEPKVQSRQFGKSSDMIFANLSGKQRGLVIPRAKWDFNEVLNSTGTYDGVGLDQEVVDRAAPIEFGRILQQSLFSLCPSSSGPNSTRLWESIACGSIPVVLSDDYLPPGSKALWEQATVSCPERLEDILALPDRLADMACDEELLKQKRHALRQLWMIYGPDCFIYDIYKLFLSFGCETVDRDRAQPKVFTYDRLYGMAAKINRSKSAEKSELDVFILGCSSRVLSDPTSFLARYKENNYFRTAYKQALGNCSLRHAESMLKALALKKIVLEHIE